MSSRASLDCLRDNDFASLMAPSIFVTDSVFAWAESLSYQEVSNCGVTRWFSWLVTNHSVSQTLKAAPGDQFTPVTSQDTPHSPGNMDMQGREGDSEDQDAATQPTPLSAAASHCRGSSSKKRMQRMRAGQFWLRLAICQPKPSSQASEMHAASALF